MRCATRPNPAAQATATSVASAIAVLAATKNSDSARVLSMWVFRANFQMRKLGASEAQRGRECPRDGYRHLRPDRERQDGRRRGGGRAEPGGARVLPGPAGLPTAPDAHATVFPPRPARADPGARPPSLR